MNKTKAFACAFVFSFVGLLLSSPLYGNVTLSLTDGQTLYTPIYSHIYTGNNEKPFLLTATLSIRNVDPNHSISVTKANYYETKGNLLKKYIDSPVVLKPLETLRYVIPQKDKSGGSGANFIVSWESDKPVNPPLVESIMIGTQIQQGVSFTSRGIVIIPSD